MFEKVAAAILIRLYCVLIRITDLPQVSWNDFGLHHPIRSAEGKNFLWQSEPISNLPLSGVLMVYLFLFLFALLVDGCVSLSA